MPSPSLKRAAWREQIMCCLSGAMNTSGKRLSGPPACGHQFSKTRTPASELTTNRARLQLRWLCKQSPPSLWLCKQPLPSLAKLASPALAVRQSRRASEERHPTFAPDLFFTTHFGRSNHAPPEACARDGRERLVGFGGGRGQGRFGAKGGRAV
eukprot:scaffold3603_cov136-Isochrysis_galbana.AAC.11